MEEDSLAASAPFDFSQTQCDDVPPVVAPATASRDSDQEDDGEEERKESAESCDGGLNSESDDDARADKEADKSEQDEASLDSHSFPAIAWDALASIDPFASQMIDCDDTPAPFSVDPVQDEDEDEDDELPATVPKRKDEAEDDDGDDEDNEEDENHGGAVEKRSAIYVTPPKRKEREYEQEARDDKRKRKEKRRRDNKKRKGDIEEEADEEGVVSEELQPTAKVGSVNFKFKLGAQPSTERLVNDKLQWRLNPAKQAPGKPTDRGGSRHGHEEEDEEDGEAEASIKDTIEDIDHEDEPQRGTYNLSLSLYLCGVLTVVRCFSFHQQDAGKRWTNRRRVASSRSSTGAARISFQATQSTSMAMKGSRSRSPNPAMPCSCRYAVQLLRPSTLKACMNACSRFDVAAVCRPRCRVASMPSFTTTNVMVYGSCTICTGRTREAFWAMTWVRARARSSHTMCWRL
jgi:hypothetical protein